MELRLYKTDEVPQYTYVLPLYPLGKSINAIKIHRNILETNMCNAICLLALELEYSEISTGENGQTCDGRLGLKYLGSQQATHRFLLLLLQSPRASR